MVADSLSSVQIFREIAIMAAMTDSELLALNQQGFFPGPLESEDGFLRRVDRVKKSLHSPQNVPKIHWDWVCHHLQELFDFSPESLPVFYSNRSLMPWQGAATWIDPEGNFSVQLREALRSGSYLRFYEREEILSHEAVHAARAAFLGDRWEEFFAYMTSEKKWRRVLGPIARRPWEIWPLLLCCLIGPWWEAAYLGALLWTLLGIGRLVQGHWTLAQASKRLMKTYEDPKQVRALLLRLTEEEIEKLARGEIVGEGAEGKSLRWRLLRLAYPSKKER